jgi:quercetin dioxygenase-like cupin family protein
MQPESRGPESNVGPFSLASASWSEPYAGSEGIPRGARRAILGTDPRTGGVTYYAHFPAGTKFELHWHAYTEYAVVLKGILTHILGAARAELKGGDYVVIPPRVPHGWEIPGPDDAYLLIRRDGPTDQHFVESP